MSILDQFSQRFGASPIWTGQHNGVTIARYQPSRGVRLAPETEVFVTAGMSDHAMEVPSADAPAHVELACAIPSGWRETWSAPTEADLFIVETLGLLSAYPFRSGTFLGAGHTIPGGRAVGPNTALCGWALFGPLLLEPGPPLENRGNPVHILTCTPVYELELSLAVAKGTRALFERLVNLVGTLQQDWGFLSLPKRPDTVGGGTFFVSGEPTQVRFAVSIEGWPEDDTDAIFEALTEWARDEHGFSEDDVCVDILGGADSPARMEAYSYGPMEVPGGDVEAWAATLVETLRARVQPLGATGIAFHDIGEEEEEEDAEDAVTEK